MIVIQEDFGAHNQNFTPNPDSFSENHASQSLDPPSRVIQHLLGAFSKRGGIGLQSK
jgi:hypothetical protein